MKKSELALLILMVGITGLLTYFVLDSFIGGNKLKPVTIDKAEKISSSIKPPSDKVFVNDAYNPTIKIKIGDQANQQPFNTASP